MSEELSFEEERPRKRIFDIYAHNWVSIELFFLRTIAVLFLCRGLYDWGVIIGFFETKGGYFEILSLNTQILIGFSAVLALISGMGLWTLNAWGNALWLFLTISLIVVDLAGFLSPRPEIQSLMRPILRTLFDIFLILAYFLVSIQAQLASERVIRS
jgi:hypothetical protein